MTLDLKEVLRQLLPPAERHPDSGRAERAMVKRARLGYAIAYHDVKQRTAGTVACADLQARMIAQDCICDGTRGSPGGPPATARRYILPHRVRRSAYSGLYDLTCRDRVSNRLVLLVFLWETYRLAWLVIGVHFNLGLARSAGDSGGIALGPCRHSNDAACQARSRTLKKRARQRVPHNAIYGCETAKSSSDALEPRLFLRPPRCAHRLGSQSL